MNRDTLLALIVWALDRDLFESISIEKALELFIKDAKRIKAVYTCKEDSLLYCPKVSKMDDAEFFTDYILCYAKMYVASGIISYGKYDNQILKYHMS
jgi:hypothetical protein